MQLLPSARLELASLVGATICIIWLPFTISNERLPAHSGGHPEFKQYKLITNWRENGNVRKWARGLLCAFVGLACRFGARARSQNAVCKANRGSQLAGYHSSVGLPVSHSVRALSDELP